MPDLHTLPGRPVRSFHVCAQGRVVLELEGRPGRLHSMAALPPGGVAPEHPFVHGVSRDPLHEHALRQALLASRDFDDYLRRLVSAGYDLISGRESVWAVTAPAKRILREARVVGAAWELSGQSSCLWSQPEGDAEVHPHAVVTVYERDDAEALARALAASRSFEELRARLASDGYSMG